MKKVFVTITLVAAVIATSTANGNTKMIQDKKYLVSNSMTDPRSNWAGGNAAITNYFDYSISVRYRLTFQNYNTNGERTSQSTEVYTCTVAGTGGRTYWVSKTVWEKTSSYKEVIRVDILSWSRA